MASHSRLNSENELIERAFNGDRDAFGELYQSYLEQIYRYVYYRIGDQYEAEDLTETVFIKAWEAIPHTEKKGLKFKAWIYRIARNGVVDRYRTHRQNVSLDETNPLSDNDANPEAVYQNNETIRDLIRHVRRLDQDFQDVILYRFILGLSHAETAEIMNRSEIYVRVLQYRALKKLRELMVKEMPGDETAG
ncbi:MAG: sigma-70 family RNA polymerase sigma factor [Chloroflexi bacterium]|nr:sigma-70 family RNA polymerase sigma factor [Chloroflexota bacterium]